MFCANCGVSLADAARFCSSCGTKVEEAVPADSGADCGRLRWGMSRADVTREYDKEGIHPAEESNALTIGRSEVAGHPFKGFLGFDAKSFALTHVVLTSCRSDEIWHDVVSAHFVTYGTDPVRSESGRLAWRTERSRLTLEDDDQGALIRLEYADKRLAGRPWVEDWLAPLVEAAEKQHALFTELLTLAGACYQTRRRQGATGDLPPMRMVKDDRTGYFPIVFEHVKSWDLRSLAVFSQRVATLRQRASDLA
jgi:hypothetical protein